MIRHLRTWFVLGTASMAILFASSNARAAFELEVTEAGGPTIPITDGGPLDLDGLANGVINVNTVGLNALLVNFAFTGLSGQSNAFTGGAGDAANINQTGTVNRTPGGGSASITVTALEDNFLFPTGDPKTMTTSASDTFTNTTAGDSRTFQSLFNGSIPSPLLAFSPPSGTGPFSTSNPGVTTTLVAQPVPYTLSDTTVITLGPSASSTAPQTDQFTGATTVSAVVPEPASFALLLLGLPLAFVRRIRPAASQA